MSWRRLLVLLLFALPFTIEAQPLDTLHPIRPMFGVGDDEFFIGGWCKVFHPSAFVITNPSLANRTMTIRASDDANAHNDSLWLWARAMGVDVLRRPMNWGFSDVQLDASTLRTSEQRLVLSGSEIIDESGYGAEAHFYFTDLIRYREEPSVFASRSGGQDFESEIELADRGAWAREQVYESSNTSAGQLIAERPAFNWAPWQTNRWEWYNDGSWKQRYDTTIQNSDYYFRRQHSRNDDEYQVNIKGRLYSGGATAMTATILRVEIWYERPRNARIMSSDGQSSQTMTANDSVLIDSFSVTRQEFLPLDTTIAADWKRYREVNHPFNPRFCLDNQTGPTYPGNSSQSFNIKVFWTGAEKVALHSLAIRDSIAHLVLNDDVAYRDLIRGRAEQMVYRATGGTRLPSVIALSLGGEEPAIQAATTARVYKWIREWMNAGTNSAQFCPDPEETPFCADSLPGWIDEGFPESLHRHYDMDFVSSEGGTSTSAWMRDPYGAPHNFVPSLVEHNGGHFTADSADYGLGCTSLPLDLLDISTPATRLANVENYEVMLQRIALGQYVPVGADVPFPTLYWKMSRAAQVARDYRRRNLFIYFNVAPVGFDIRDSVGSDDVTHRRLDTVVGHIPEASEQRAVLSTALAYGNKGIHYQVLDAQTNVLGDPQTFRNNFREGVAIDWGSNGTLTSDTSQNKVTSIRFKQADQNGWYGDDNGYNILNLYVGWGNRSRETKLYNRWLKDSIGPLLMKLNWRDAYSIHYSVPQPYQIKKYKYRVVTADQWDSVYYRSVGHRPLPTDEIITDVRSYRRDWIGAGANRHDTLIADSLTRTYVELGLFYRQNSTLSRLFDTNWAMIVNRRAFERPAEVSDKSPRGRLMDTLAEMRTISLKLNLLNFEQFNFVRVREMGADVTPLPLASGPRPALDTIVHADSSIRLTLRPGGAALLRITYALPDTTLVAGRLPFSCQRKLIWDPDQRRYHSVYMMGTDSSRIDSVCYRRSVPMSDSNETILWEPDDYSWLPGYWGYALSRTNDDNDSIVTNRHPSLTIRRTPAGAAAPAGTMITAVWTAHRVPINFLARQVLARTIWSPDGTGPALMDMLVEVVDSAVHGRPESGWGTPVVSRTDGADIIAWSDSLVGIKAVARVMRDPQTIPEWWRSPAVYTDTIHVSAAQTARFGRPGKFPSVPTFAHILSRDSNVAVVWEQPRAGLVDAPTASDIYFKRLLHTVTATADTLEALDSSLAIVNPRSGLHRHPSITQHQAYWKQVQDQVVWEEKISTWWLPKFVVHVRSIFTETRSPSLNPPDIIIPKPQLWGEVAVVTRRRNLDWTYPNIASLTYGDSVDNRKGRATVAHNYEGWNGDTTLMAEASVLWADIRMDWRPYTYGGRYLSNSETPDSQRTRHAVLYEVGQGATRKLRTTREYYLGRARPAGYLADGRQLAMRMNDSTGSGYSFVLIDAWRADAVEAAPIELVGRDTSLRIINDLNDARSLLRTKYFSASDSTTIGMLVAAGFDGDTTGYSATSMTYVVELVDSASGTVVCDLDSFSVSAVSPTRQKTLTSDLDLVSGTYFIRARIDTSAIVIPQWTGDSRYPVSELVMFVDDSSAAFKLRRPRTVAATNLRVTAQPNPATSMTEARFTINQAGRVRLILSDYSGRNTAVLVDEWMTPGRYALDLDTKGLAPGTYMVHVLAGSATGTVKVLVLP